MFACTESLRICLVTCGFSLIGWEMILRDGILFVFSNNIRFPESLKRIHVIHNICENCMLEKLVKGWLLVLGIMYINMSAQYKSYLLSYHWFRNQNSVTNCWLLLSKMKISSKHCFNTLNNCIFSSLLMTNMTFIWW